MEEKQILCVGLVVLDIINVVDKYPEEDTDSRCLSQRWQRGGNASNSCTVLSLLGAPCAFMGSLAPGHVADFVLDDFGRYSVDLCYVVLQSTGSVPISTVVVSEASGSRTILHAHRFVHLSASCQPPPSPPPSSLSRTLLLSEAPRGCSATPRRRRSRPRVASNLCLLALPLARAPPQLPGG